jgi:hypothetical protein
MTDNLRAAVATIKRITPEGVVWGKDDLHAYIGYFSGQATTILNAVASGDLVLKADVQGLVEALTAIAGLGSKSGHEFARLYPDLNKKLDDVIHEHWAAVLSEHADEALTAWENRK